MFVCIFRFLISLYKLLTINASIFEFEDQTKHATEVARLGLLSFWLGGRQTLFVCFQFLKPGYLKETWLFFAVSQEKEEQSVSFLAVSFLCFPYSLLQTRTTCHDMIKKQVQSIGCILEHLTEMLYLIVLKCMNGDFYTCCQFRPHVTLLPCVTTW